MDAAIPNKLVLLRLYIIVIFSIFDYQESGNGAYFSLLLRLIDGMFVLLLLLELLLLLDTCVFFIACLRLQLLADLGVPLPFVVDPNGHCDDALVTY